jgi:hypothetical protein
MTAFAEGKTIEWKDGNGAWFPGDGNISFLHEPGRYRIKPEPKKRLIRVEELPPVCWVKVDGPFACLVIGRDFNDQRLKIETGGFSIRQIHDDGGKWSSDLKTWDSFEVEDSE